MMPRMWDMSPSESLHLHCHVVTVGKAGGDRNSCTGSEAGVLGMGRG